MILDLRESTTFPAELSVRANPGELKVDFESLESLGAVQMEVAVQKVGERFYCQGEVRAEVVLACSRCLGSFSKELVGTVDFVIRYEQESASEEGIIDDEDYVLIKGDDLRVDVSEIARQAVGFGIEIMPLCSEACLGLCPGCGTDRNKTQCNCNDKVIDERWSALKDLAGK